MVHCLGEVSASDGHSSGEEREAKGSWDHQQTERRRQAYAVGDEADECRRAQKADPCRHVHGLHRLAGQSSGRRDHGREKGC